MSRLKESNNRIPMEALGAEDATHIFGTCKLDPEGGISPGDIKEFVQADAELDALRIRT